MGVHRSLLYSELLILKASKCLSQGPVLIKMTRITESFSRKGHPDRLEIKVAYP